MLELNIHLAISQSQSALTTSDPHYFRSLTTSDSNSYYIFYVFLKNYFGKFTTSVKCWATSHIRSSKGIILPNINSIRFPQQSWWQSERNKTKSNCILLSCYSKSQPICLQIVQIHPVILIIYNQLNAVHFDFFSRVV